MKKPKYFSNESDNSNSNSRCSTPVGSSSSTPTRGISTRYGGRGRSTPSDYARKSIFLHDSLRVDDSYQDDEGNSDFEDKSGTDDLEDPLEDRDSEFSLEDDESVYSEESFETGNRRKALYFRRPISPEIIDEDTIPPLELPQSSNDLNFEHDTILKALGIYEVLRHYRVILRLSPFRFEDFLQALRSEEQSCLLTEIHITLLRALQREEEANNTTFGPQDVKDSVNIMFYFLDPMSWTEVVRCYLDSANASEFKAPLPVLDKPDYLSTNVHERLQILQTLADLFLVTSAVREHIMNEGNIRYDDHCRNCHK